MRNGEKKRKKVFNKRLQFIEKNQNTSLKYFLRNAIASRTRTGTLNHRT